eukprot:5899467-Amphidinium_carterae.2
MEHPSREQFIRILRNSGASERVLQMARDLKCSVCQQMVLPDSQRRGAVVPCVGFNQMVGADLFFLAGSDPEDDFFLSSAGALYIRFALWSRVRVLRMFVRLMLIHGQNTLARRAVSLRTKGRNLPARSYERRNSTRAYGRGCPLAERPNGTRGTHHQDDGFENAHV